MSKNIYKVLQKKELFDSHTHISSEDFDTDRNQVIKNAQNNKLDSIFDVGVDLSSSMLSLDIAKTTNMYIKSFVGLDPELFTPNSSIFIGFEINKNWFKDTIANLKVVIENNRDYVVGIGETGMDYYWLNQMLDDNLITKEDVKKSKSLQKKLFILQLELASEFNLPVTLHSRGAEKECLDIVKKFPNVKGIFHSYTGDYETAKEIIKAGWGIGVNGIITFKNAYQLRSMYKKILGKVTKDWKPEQFYKKGIFFETDAPYLSPDGKRGERNEPANVKDIYEFMINNL